jgi:hypothetical protein
MAGIISNHFIAVFTFLSFISVRAFGIIGGGAVLAGVGTLGVLTSSWPAVVGSLGRRFPKSIQNKCNFL